MADMHAFYRPMGYKTYEKKDWLGTPRLTYSDIKRPDDPTLEKFYYTFKLDYLSATTTYPFGARIDSLSFEKPSFRFGFTGHLKDNIIRPEKGDGANYSTLFREYDPIIGRWWSIDPLKRIYAAWSPYNYAIDDPINYLDPNGSKIKKVVNLISEGLSAHMAMNSYEDFQKTTLFQEVENDAKEYVLYLTDYDSKIDDIKQLNLYDQSRRERLSSRHNGPDGFIVINYNQISPETPWPVHFPHEFGHARRYQLGINIPTAGKDAKSPLNDNGYGVEMEEVFTVYFYEDPWRAANGFQPRPFYGGKNIFPCVPAMQLLLTFDIFIRGREILKKSRIGNSDIKKVTPPSSEAVPVPPPALPAPPDDQGDSLPHS